MLALVRQRRQGKGDSQLMCGIAGFFDPTFKLRRQEELLREMGEGVAHRGPDANGEWYDPVAGLGLAHRRLSIIDLSGAGSQPMKSHCGRYVMVFNGEIYNFESLRRELELKKAAPAWRGHSDTEVLIECISEWGVEQTLRQCNGMFAFALWDREKHELVLARDRFGEKPLYYSLRGSLLYFGSELRAIDRLPGATREMDPEAVGLLFRFGCIPAPRSIWKGVHKLPPSTWIRFRFERGSLTGDGPDQYWSATECAVGHMRERLEMPDEAVVDSLDAAMRHAVRLRMRSDVPLGAFLSGGIDSSIVVAAMQVQSTQPINTYSISYGDPGYDEGPYAKAVAGWLGTRHTELRVDPSMAVDVVPELPRIYDEPFADVSQIPTYLVSRLARTEVAVALSGDGGDEIFGGYTRYLWAPRLWRAMSVTPRWVRSLVGGGVRWIPRGSWDRAVGVVNSLLPFVPRFTTPGYKLHRFADICSVRDELELYQRLISLGQNLQCAVRRSAGVGVSGTSWPEGVPFREAMMLQDTITYLSDDVLTKVDRASMSVGLEVRAPFLDPDLFGLAWTLPDGGRFREGVGKWVLRGVLARYIPKQLIDRPKMGFAVPFGGWLRNELREWAEDLLSDHALRQSDLLEVEPIRQMWKEHVAGKNDNEYSLWPVLTFQSWVRDRARS